MIRLDYAKERMQKVLVRGILCEFNDMRIDRNTIPEGKFMYEVADDDSDGEPARIRPGILVNFFGTIICNQKLEPDEGDTIWLQDDEWEWM